MQYQADTFFKSFLFFTFAVSLQIIFTLSIQVLPELKEQSNVTFHDPTN